MISSVIPRAAAVIGFEVEHDFPTIGQRTFLVDARRLVHPDNNSPNILIIFDDVTERQRHDAEMDFIVAEMRHRIKNLSAVVQAVVSNVKTDEPAIDRFKHAIMGRLETTFRAQEVAASGKPADFEDLLSTAVGQTVSERLVCAGPGIDIPSSKIPSISMIFHELGTNATKHGSASVQEGKVQVTWTSEAGPGDRTLLVCHWREEGGPPVSQPERTGYGTELIEGLASHLGGSVERHYAPDRFTAVIRFSI